MSAPPLVCAALEIALNRYLALEPAIAAQLGTLQGRVLALHAQGLGWEFFICPQASRVQVLDRWDGRPDVRVSAPPGQLLRQAVRSGRGDRSVVEGVQVEGDAGLLSRFSELLLQIGFDPEEWLARWVGGGAAHRLNQGLGSVLNWGREAASTLALDTAEYLREETRDLVHRADVEQWAGQVETLQSRVERLAARVERLERRA